MPIKFVDNVLTTLGANLAIGATSMTVAVGDGVLFSAVNDFFDSTDGQYVTLIRASDGAIEVIKIKDHDGASDAITLIGRDVQGVHGGVGLAFVTADTVDVRIPSELLDTFVQQNPNNAPAAAASMQWLRDVASGAQGVNRCVVIGPGTTVEARGPGGHDCVVIGHDAKSTNDTLGRNVIIGRGATSSSPNVVAIGYLAVAAGNGAISIGSGSRANGSDGITIGDQSFITEDLCIWIGGSGNAGFGDGEAMIAIGHDHDLSVGSGNDNGIIIGRGFTSKRPGADSFVITRPITMNTTGKTDAAQAGMAVGNSGVENVVCTQVIDFKNGSPFELNTNAFHEFAFGSNGLFFVEQVEIWVQVVFGGAISQAPGIKVGSTVGASDILATHIFGTGFVTNSRERVTGVLLPDRGFNSVWLEVTQPAIGPTVMQGVYIIRGTLYGQ